MLSILSSSASVASLDDDDSWLKRECGEGGKLWRCIMEKKDHFGIFAEFSKNDSNEVDAAMAMAMAESRP